MTDFADVEQFAREHAGCGGLTPGATPQAAGGFVLTLTCTCGATFERRVTAEEAKQPLPQITIAPRAAAPRAPAPPPPSPAPPPSSRSETPPPAAPPPRSRRSAERPRVAPSRELEDALRAALEAEPEAVERPTSAPAPKPAKGAAREDLEALMRQALAAEEAAAAAPAPPARSATPPAGTGPTSQPRSPVTRLDLDLTIREALDRQRADAAEPRETDEPVTRRMWLVFVAVAAVGAAASAAYWYFGQSEEEDDVPTSPNAPQMPSEERAALEEVLKSLRQLQTSTPPDSTIPVYASRVLVVKGDVEKFSQSTAPSAARASAREFLELHQLAVSTLRARSLDRKDTFDVLSRDPTLTLCPEVRSVLDRALQTSNLSPEDARAAAVSAALPRIWDCARARLTALERTLSGPR